VERARAVLGRLEANGGATKVEIADELPLFAQVMEDNAPTALEQALSAINPDHLTPKQALEALYEIKRLLDEKG
jgi:DNA mismatch repair protein MutS